MGVVVQVKIVLAAEPIALDRARALVADLIDGGFVAGGAAVELGPLDSLAFAYVPIDQPIAGLHALYAGAEREPLLEAIARAGESDVLVRFLHLNEGALTPEAYLAELDDLDEEELDELQVEECARARIRTDDWLGERFLALYITRTPRMLALTNAYMEEDDDGLEAVGPACVWLELEGKHVPMDDVEGTRLATLLTKHGLGPLAIGTGAW